MSKSHILRVKDKDYFPVVVVANKCDLDYDRQVDVQGTLHMSQMWTIAHRGVNVNRGRKHSKAIRSCVH
ncbi:hypothetical protein QFC19_004609 [Naganishia cerealis]|uniref:Uncharacterized protein n=1 Tax=Naganishia cerealis TaxID=610337 RepID=A0ACC2VTW3_9TREE|nr:hypothetical protein QFC19_004609 [Naganishia cerealis]